MSTFCCGCKPTFSHEIFKSVFFHKDAKIKCKYFTTLWFFVHLKRTNGMKNLIWGSVFCLFAVGATAQSSLSPLYFQSGTVQPTGFSTWNSPWSKGEIQSGKGVRIIQFAQIPSQKQIETIKSFGIEFLDYMPEKAYFASKFLQK